MNTADGTASLRDSSKKAAQLALWTIAWAATLAAARFGPQFAWDAQQQHWASWTAIVVNVLVGIGWIVAFARYLRALDDLWRKIMLDALAATLGVGWVAGFAYVAADLAGLVTDDVNMGVFPALLGGVYLVAIVVGWVRYR